MLWVRRRVLARLSRGVDASRRRQARPRPHDRDALAREHRPRVPDASGRAGQAHGYTGPGAGAPRRPPRVGPAREPNVTGHSVTTPGRDFHERSAHAVADPQLQHALRNLDRRLRTAEEVATAHPEWKERAAAIRRETLADLDGWLDRLERALTGNGVQVHRAANCGRRPQHRHRHRACARCAHRRQGQVDGDRRDRPRHRAGSRGDACGRDRPRRVHRAARGRAAVAHDHARDPQDAAADPRRARREKPDTSCRSTGKRSPRGRANGCATEFLAPTSASRV